MQKQLLLLFIFCTYISTVSASDRVVTTMHHGGEFNSVRRSREERDHIGSIRRNLDHLNMDNACKQELQSLMTVYLRSSSKQQKNAKNLLKRDFDRKLRVQSRAHKTFSIPGHFSLMNPGLKHGGRSLLDNGQTFAGGTPRSLRNAAVAEVDSAARGGRIQKRFVEDVDNTLKIIQYPQKKVETFVEINVPADFPDVHKDVMSALDKWIDPYLRYYAQVDKRIVIDIKPATADSFLLRSCNLLHCIRYDEADKIDGVLSSMFGDIYKPQNVYQRRLQRKNDAEFRYQGLLAISANKQDFATYLKDQQEDARLCLEACEKDLLCAKIEKRRNEILCKYFL